MNQTRQQAAQTMEGLRARADWVTWLLLGLTAVPALLCLLSGGVLYVWIVADWAQGSTGFSGLQMIGWLVGVISAGVVCLGFLFAGLFLRVLDWRAAPRASLWLAILSAGFVLATFLIFSDTGHSEDSIEVVVLQALCVVVLFITALPPFLHWLLAGRTSRSAARATPRDSEAP